MNLKTCTKCKETKPLDGFGKHKQTKDGLSCWCKTCTNASSKRIRGTPAGVYTSIKGRNKFYRSKPFEITKEWFVDWYVSQEKKCAYCDLPESKLPFLKDTFNHKLHRMSIDCMNNPLGYVVGNLVLSCLRCNYIKSDLLSYEEMREIGQRYIKPYWEKQLGPIL